MLRLVGSLALPALLATALGCSAEERRHGAPPPSAMLESGTIQRRATEVNPRLLRRFQPLPATFERPGRPPASPAQVALGRKLFYEPNLSRDGSVSCNTCHDLRAYGVDGQPVSRGISGQLGTRNAPTVYNAAGAFAQFWDGREPTVEEQAKGPILHPCEMGMPDGNSAVEALRSSPGYERAFREAFPGDPEPLRWQNVGEAIGAFERGLVTPARWDRFLRGDTEALTRAERDGLRTFLDVGCMVCHTGPLVGGSMYARAGVVEPWPNQADRGRGAVTNQTSDDLMFRVPSLRNVEKTAPYFHDGSGATLEEAVRLMGKHQLGLDLTAGEIASIASWLKSLTGSVPGEYIAGPPTADDATPGPDVVEPRPDDSPLQRFMKANLATALAARDFARLERALTHAAELGAPEHPRWASIARAGANAADRGDLESVRATCNQCHDAYRASYRKNRGVR